MTQQVDEETPLLQEQPKKRTPIPWGQFTIVMFLQLTEPLTSQVIYPFAPQLIRDIGITNGNETQVGYYVGLMQSLFFLTQALTVLHWSRTSDFIGRKPVLLIGLLGLSLSMYCFGLSSTFWGLVLSRCLNGALNPVRWKHRCNEKAYAYQPIAWSTGGTLGPIIGGSLSRPAERFPELFGNNELLKKYPYFLPCAVPATYTAIAWLITFLFFKETLKSPVSISRLFKLRKAKVDSPVKGVIRSQDSLTPQDPDACDEEKPLPLRDLLTPRVLIAAGNYACLSLVDIAFRAIQPLFLSTPIAFGGLGLSPPVIGKILSAYGICNGVFQVFFFAFIHDHFGSKKTFVVGLACAFPCFIAFPMINAMAKSQGVTPFVWAAIALQALISIGLNLSFGAIFIFIAAASPNRASIGATNGLSQMTVSVMRAIGPAATNSLFSLSIEKNYLSGHLVYYVLIAVALMALSRTQTREAKRDVQVALAERTRREELKRKKAEEQDKKEQELARKRRMMIFEEEKKERERQLKREQEQAAIEAERQKRAEMERNSYQHGPKKAKALSDGSAPKWPSSDSQARTREEVRKRRLPDDEDDDSSAPEFLTREEKRQRKQQQEMRRLFQPTKRSATSHHRAGKRLPGGAVDVMTSSQPASDASSSTKSVRERLTAMPNTLTKLNTVKRDTRTIDEIMQDRARLREGKTLEGDQARGFDNWFMDKKEAKKVTSTSNAPSGADTPSSRESTESPLHVDTIHFSCLSEGRSATPQPPASSTLSKKPAPPLKPSPLKAAATRAVSSSSNLKSSSANSKFNTSSSKSNAVSSTKALNGAGGPKSSASVGKKRPRSPSLSEESDLDSLPPRRQAGSGYSDAIWGFFGKNRDKYVNRDVFSDDEDMEADASALEREELRSARLAKKEDQLALEEERRHEEVKRRRKKEKERLAREMRG
ncbi:hypothetical protein C0995_007057 [Termitomyces sp. Mi166|nr:hypothetical protein C0995_007057 [Termitomyces sp. Mi166\